MDAHMMDKELAPLSVEVHVPMMLYLKIVLLKYLRNYYV